MSYIHLNNVSVEYSIFNAKTRSIKNLLFPMESLSRKIINKKIGGLLNIDINNNVKVLALSNLTLKINTGDRLGIIGHNGSGKSTLLRLLAGVYEPTSGNIDRNGLISTIFSTGEGLDTESTGMDAINFHAKLHGITGSKYLLFKSDIENFTELGDYLYLPTRTYSTGMLVRLTFALATFNHNLGEILLMDEVIGAGDAHFIKKTETRMKNFLESSEIVVVATHSMDILHKWCNKVVLLEKGSIRYYGDVKDGISLYENL